MTDRCPDCGASYALVGRVHNCRPRPITSSSGSVEGHAISGTAEHCGKAPAQKPPAGIKPGPLEAKKGRPRIEDAHKTLAAQEPWTKAGMSRATWFRRKAERAAK